MAEVGQKSNKMRIAVIPGDGIGHEVVPEGIRVLEAVGRKFDLAYEFTTYDWSCERFHKTGAMMPKDGLDQIRDSDAIYLGAVGFPGVPDHVSLWGLLIPIRRDFHQYINLRPVRLFEGLDSPLAGRKPGDIDYWIVRENNEGEYSSIGGRMYEGTELEAAIQQAVFTRKGCDRVMRYAFELGKVGRAQVRHVGDQVERDLDFDALLGRALRGHLDGISRASRPNQFHIDILTCASRANPDWFDVIVGSNLFGDILSDLGPATTGTIAIAPGGNINPEKDYPSMFEPVHGSAPDIAGKGIANPIGQIWSGAMMLEHLGHAEAAAAIVGAIEKVILEKDVLTPDMGGKATCSELGQAIADLI